MIIKTIAVVIGLCVTTCAHALPCLGKLEHGADRYRIVDGQRCWYIVGERVPEKTRFTKPKRKEVVRRAEPNRAVHKTVPAAAKSMAEFVPAKDDADDAWLEMKRLQGRDALCGGIDAACPDFSAAEHVRESFDALSAAVVTFSSAPLRELEPNIAFRLAAKREEDQR
jgi:hypothetical protein